MDSKIYLALYFLLFPSLSLESNSSSIIFYGMHNNFSQILKGKAAVMLGDQVEVLKAEHGHDNKFPVIQNLREVIKPFETSKCLVVVDNF